ncbi:MAG: methyltransferase domain-containing protein [Caldilineaceae bacterium]|nr:methyltransferase domain-containing protein [Caldilineaceae bacterium]
MRVLFICHAEDMHDLYDYLGNESSGLTAQGWEQADLLATWLRAHELIDALISDNLLQCRLTAQRVGQAMGLPVTVFRELPSCTAAPAEAESRGMNGRTLMPSAAEVAVSSLTEEEALLMAALDKLFAEHWGTTLAVVTCNPNIVTLLRVLTGPGRVDLRIDHTSITEICFVNGKWRVNYVNRISHLTAPVVTPRNAREEVAHTPEELEDLSTVVRVYNRVAMNDLNQKREDDHQRIRHLLNFAKLPADLRILDIGTGIGLLPLLLAEDGAKQVVGIDISPEMLEQAEYLRLSRPNEASSRTTYRLAPAHALPFRDEQFDAVTCRLVLNHARRPERIIKEIVRVLRPGGILVLAELLGVDNPVKRATQNAIEERRNAAHVAARGAEQYNKLLTDAGLQIEAKETVTFERGLDEWLAIYHTDRADAAVVREMIEAGLETDAAGINARRQGGTLVFDQRMVYVRAVKPGTRTAA